MKHKLGIIGYGTMGSWHAANVRDRIKDLDVALVYDINPEKRERHARKALQPVKRQKNCCKAMWIWWW